MRQEGRGGEGKERLNEERIKERSRKGSGKREMIVEEKNFKERERNEEGMKESGHKGRKEGREKYG